MLSNSKTRRAGSDSLLLRIPTPEALPITCTSPSFTDDVSTRKGSDACPAEVGRSQRQASRALSRRRAMCMPRVMLLSVRRVLAGGEEGVHGSGIAVRSPVQAICCRLAAASEQPCSLVPGPCLSSLLLLPLQTARCGLQRHACIELMLRTTRLYLVPLSPVAIQPVSCVVVQPWRLSTFCCSKAMRGARFIVVLNSSQRYSIVVRPLANTRYLQV